MFQKFGRYEIIKPIGHGSFGMVYRAKDPNLDRFVAIKVINHLVSDPRVLEAIRNEARLTANLSPYPHVHPVTMVNPFDDGLAGLYPVPQVTQRTDL